MNTRRWLVCLAVPALCGLAVVVSDHGLGSRDTARESPPMVSGAFGALDAWTAQRAYPGQDIPEEASAAAYAYSKQHLAPADPEKGGGWSSIGPHNMGGRTLAIAISEDIPDVIWAGSASGGLWRSGTGGVGASAWRYVSTGFPVLAVAAIALDPRDPGTIYIGTGEVYNHQGAELFGEASRALRGSYGIGILKSTDGGASWASSLDWTTSQRRGVQALKIDPASSERVWAATTHGVIRSTDAGGSWEQVLDVAMATDLVIVPSDPDVVIAACGNFSSADRGIYRTTDGGATWTKRWPDNPTFRGKILLALSPGSPGDIFASVGSGFDSPQGEYTWLMKSSDNGLSWSQVSAVNYATYQGWFSHDVAVNPSDPSELFAVGVEVWRSLDGGAHLQQRSRFTPYSGQVPPGEPEGPSFYVHSDVHDVVYHPTNHDVVYFATDGGVFRTVDGGGSFEGCNGGYQTTQFFNGFSTSSNDPDFAMGGLQDNNTIIYLGSTAWSKFHVGGDGAWTAIDPRYADNSVIFGSSQYLRILRSDDRAASWFEISPGGSTSATVFIAPFALCPSEPDVLYAGRNIIYKSVNGGATWSATNSGAALDGNPMLVIVTSPQSSDVVYSASAPSGTRGHVFRTTNGGASWDNVTGGLPDRYPSDLALAPEDDMTVYVSFSGFGSSHLFRSYDGGESWQDIGTSLPDVPTNAIVVDPVFATHIYVGNDIGVYVSWDNGATWQELTHGLPDAVAAFDLSITPNRKLRVATHGNGVYERDLPPSADPVRRGAGRRVG